MIRRAGLVRRFPSFSWLGTDRRPSPNLWFSTSLTQ